MLQISKFNINFFKVFFHLETGDRNKSWNIQIKKKIAYKDNFKISNESFNLLRKMFRVVFVVKS